MKPMERPLFSRTGSISPGRSVFDLSYSKMFDCDMGQLIPVMCDEVVPGDIFTISNEVVLRFTPMVAPMMHEVNIYVHYFFVPYRLLWSNWEVFITGGIDGQNADVLPTWNPTNTAKYSLWDYLGFPVGIVPTGSLPIAFPKFAYNLIYNSYYRDETLIAAITLNNESILKRAWTKDYFTSALPWQQRGTAPALPISGTTQAVFPSSMFAYGGSINQNVVTSSALNDLKIGGTTNIPTDNVRQVFGNNTVNLATATTFNVKDLRLAFQIQRWMERNARAGARYTEFLQAHFGVSPTDERLDRPEYIGGSKSPVIVSEVLQTSGTGASGQTTPQGNLAGHGISVDQSMVGKYRVEEFGLIMGIMSIMPKPAYCQGINRQWLRKTRYDFYSPEFANLSEQAIQQVELYATAVQAENETIFGYQGRYDEMRYKPSMFAGGMRDSTYNYWHLGRIFASAPILNQSFIEMDGTTAGFKRPFAVTSMPVCIVNFGNRIKAVRPMPIMAEPGLIDHDGRQS